MPDEVKDEPKMAVENTPQSTEVIKNHPIKSRNKEEMQMLLAQLSDSTPNSSPQQIEKIIDARSRAQELIREDHKDNFSLAKEDKRNERHFLYVIAIAVVILSLAVLIFKPDLLSQLITALLSGGGGYGIGKMKSDKRQEENE